MLQVQTIVRIRVVWSHTMMYTNDIQEETVVCVHGLIGKHEAEEKLAGIIQHYANVKPIYSWMSYIFLYIMFNRNATGSIHYQIQRRSSRLACCCFHETS